MIDERTRYLKVGKEEDLLVYPCSGEFNKARLVAILSEEDIVPFDIIPLPRMDLSEDDRKLLAEFKERESEIYRGFLCQQEGDG
tara:strand:+ start:785 stop:1036 length:252 start_codon:yes stop_codon:yes gene_type:complete